MVKRTHFIYSMLYTPSYYVQNWHKSSSHVTFQGFPEHVDIRPFLGSLVRLPVRPLLLPFRHPEVLHRHGPAGELKGIRGVRPTRCGIHGEQWQCQNGGRVWLLLWSIDRGINNPCFTGPIVECESISWWGHPRKYRVKEVVSLSFGHDISALSLPPHNCPGNLLYYWLCVL